MAKRSKIPHMKFTGGEPWPFTYDLGGKNVSEESQKVLNYMKYGSSHGKSINIPSVDEIDEWMRVKHNRGVLPEGIPRIDRYKVNIPSKTMMEHNRRVSEQNLKLGISGEIHKIPKKYLPTSRGYKPPVRVPESLYVWKSREDTTKKWVWEGVGKKRKRYQRMISNKTWDPSVPLDLLVADIEAQYPGIEISRGPKGELIFPRNKSKYLQRSNNILDTYRKDFPFQVSHALSDAPDYVRGADLHDILPRDYENILRRLEARASHKINYSQKWTDTTAFSSDALDELYKSMEKDKWISRGEMSKKIDGFTRKGVFWTRGLEQKPRNWAPGKEPRYKEIFKYFDAEADWMSDFEREAKMLGVVQKATAPGIDAVTGDVTRSVPATYAERAEAVISGEKGGAVISSLNKAIDEKRYLNWKEDLLYGPHPLVDSPTGGKMIDYKGKRLGGALEDSWYDRIKSLEGNDAAKRELVARLKRYRSVEESYKRAIDEHFIATKAAKGDLSAITRMEIPELVATGKLSFVNPLAPEMVQPWEIETRNLAREVARAEIRTGVFEGGQSLVDKGYTHKEIRRLSTPFWWANRFRKNPYTGKYGGIFATHSAIHEQWLDDVFYSDVGKHSETIKKVGRSFYGTADEFLSKKTTGIAAKAAAASRTAEDIAIYSSAGPLETLKGKAKHLSSVSVYGNVVSEGARKRATGRKAMASVAGRKTGAGKRRAAAAISQINRDIIRNSAASGASAKAVDIFAAHRGKMPVTFEKYLLSDVKGIDLSAYKNTKYGVRVKAGGKIIGTIPYKKAGRQGALINEIAEASGVKGWIGKAGWSVPKGKSNLSPYVDINFFLEKSPGKFSAGRSVNLAGVESYAENIASLFPRPQTAKAASKILQKESVRASRTDRIFSDTMSKMKMPSGAKLALIAGGIALSAFIVGRNVGRGSSVGTPGEIADKSLYGGMSGKVLYPEGMEEQERAQDQPSTYARPSSYSARIKDPNSSQININVRGKTKYKTDYAAVGDALGKMMANEHGARTARVNVRSTDDTRKMDDEHIKRKIARLI